MPARIIIVGNGSIDPSLAAFIDTHDLVIRFNGCRSFDQAPSRTDVVAVCNTGRPACEMLGAPGWSRHPAIRAATEIWSVRPPRFFAAERARIVREHPQLADLCDDFTDGFIAFCERTAKRHRVISEAIHRRTARALLPHAPAPYVTPSSGLIVIEHALAHWPEARIAVAGFDHTGWWGHPFDAEARLVEHYVRQGLLQRGLPARHMQEL
ncbi:Urease operon accessory protein [Ancylobacter oerskovii]|uniref:Urease operon accessory protein n=1 Tax=Ancylobacter oerskovii TaxID=459519 RepID=A0ABW4YW15_9HYPH|nr:Urease operon accessory protein [Ancylobacter oerskovii]MBS7544187.1 Urease operon accessory protein [Ancylobacter oerskovii]